MNAMIKAATANAIEITANLLIIAEKEPFTFPEILDEMKYGRFNSIILVQY